MGNILYIIAIILVILWAVGYFGYSADQFIHLLMVIAAGVLLIRIIGGRKLFP